MDLNADAATRQRERDHRQIRLASAWRGTVCFRNCGTGHRPRRRTSLIAPVSARCWTEVALAYGGFHDSICVIAIFVSPTTTVPYCSIDEVGVHFRHQCHRQLSRRRGVQDIKRTRLAAATSCLTTSARTAARAKKGFTRLRHVQSRGESSCARTRHRTPPGASRQLWAVNELCDGSCKARVMLPAAIASSLASVKYVIAPRRGRSGLTRRQFAFAQFYADRTVDEVAHHARWTRRKRIFARHKRLSKTNGWSHHCGRRFARGVFALKAFGNERA